MKPHLPGAPASERPNASFVIRHSSLPASPLHPPSPIPHPPSLIPHLSSRAKRSGFTLIEVLIAMFVFSMALIALSSAFTDTLTTLGTLSVDRTPVEDLRFVRSTVIQEPDLAKFEEGGEIETLSCGLATWEAVVEPTTVSDLFDVELSITLTPPNGIGNNANRQPLEETYVFHLRLLRPTWSKAADRSEILQDNKQRLESIRSEQGLK